MIDKSGESGGKNQSGFDDEFDEDLSKLTEDFELDDDMGMDANAEIAGQDEYTMGDDDLLGMDDDSELMDDSGLDDNYNVGADQAAAGSSSFLKNYGILIIVLLGVGYYAFKYTADMFMGSSPARTAVAKKPKSVATQPPVEQAQVSTPASVEQKESNKQEGNASQMAKEPEARQQMDAQLESQAPQPSQDTPVAELEMKLDTDGVAELTSQSKVAVDQNGNAIEPGDSQVVALSGKIEELLGSVQAVNRQIDTKSTQNLTQVEGVKKLLGQINSNLQDVTEYVQSAGKAINLLSKQLKEQEAVLSTIVDSTVTEQIGLSQNFKSMMQSGGLTINAIIPGQAWLKTASGEIILVNMGDNIPGYGKVVDIDPISTTVTTDKGRVIK